MRRLSFLKISRFSLYYYYVLVIVKFLSSSHEIFWEYHRHSLLVVSWKLSVLIHPDPRTAVMSSVWLNQLNEKGSFPMLIIWIRNIYRNPRQSTFSFRTHSSEWIIIIIMFRIHHLSSSLCSHPRVFGVINYTPSNINNVSVIRIIHLFLFLEAISRGWVEIDFTHHWSTSG